jgi:hypothetical protein
VTFLRQLERLRMPRKSPSRSPANKANQSRSPQVHSRHRCRNFGCSITSVDSVPWSAGLFFVAVLFDYLALSGVLRVVTAWARRVRGSPIISAHGATQAEAIHPSTKVEDDRKQKANDGHDESETKICSLNLLGDGTWHAVDLSSDEQRGPTLMIYGL